MEVVETHYMEVEIMKMVEIYCMKVDVIIQIQTPKYFVNQQLKEILQIL